ncbi:ead/Ea22-like family protein [Escherichia coli]|uniref:ead/Ea22-like family protein n=1 Tax=Escherichia coli TaxID=562 RepID=UPI000932549D|nr:ead/Ea22-like family protein [Escherichia coli]MCN3422957.1 ead/Ea22-like family protein [Escherichia coli]MCY0016779.1 ead/Ea22-like family protein [Escherichia coli]
MSEINYQALREAAERAIPAMERLLMLPADDDLLSEQELKDYGVDIDALNAFKFLTGPETVLALLDERERNQQYIKRRDQENEDIALTVGKLRVELEAAEKRIAELEAEPVSNSDELPLDYLQGHKDGLEWAAQLAEANHPQTGDWLYDDPIDLARAIRKGPDMPTVQAGNYPVTPDGWISCSERMPAQDDWILIYSKHGEYMAGQVQGEYVELSDGTLSWLGNALYWMPLPEPPQEVN